MNSLCWSILIFDNSLFLTLMSFWLHCTFEDIAKLRVVLESAEAKEKEREWLKNQLSGDLDDAKIVDGASGENRIYRKRGKPDTKLGLTQKLPKRIVFAVDIRYVVHGL